MPMSRLVSLWTLGCATLGSVALIASHAGASPTADQVSGSRDRVNAGNIPESGVADANGVVRAAAMDDRFHSDEAREARGKNEDGRWKHRGNRGGHGPVTPSSPIPEPASVMLFAAGLGLVGLYAWKSAKGPVAAKNATRS